jgi:hypothetical protein
MSTPLRKHLIYSWTVGHTRSRPYRRV